MAELPGKELAQELMQKSREESRRTPMEAVIEAAREGRFQQQESVKAGESLALVPRESQLSKGEVIR